MWRYPGASLLDRDNIGTLNRLLGAGREAVDVACLLLDGDAGILEYPGGVLDRRHRVREQPMSSVVLRCVDSHAPRVADQSEVPKYTLARFSIGEHCLAVAGNAWILSHGKVSGLRC